MGAAPSVNVCVGGLQGSGKSAFTYTVAHGELFGRMQPSTTVVQKTLFTHEEIPFRIMDIGGTVEREQNIETMGGAHAVVFMIDATNKADFAEAAWEIYLTGRIVQPDVPIVVVINSKMEPQAIPFDSLFPMFSRHNLPPGRKEWEELATSLEVPLFEKETTSHGYVIDKEKLSEGMEVSHSGPFAVVPLESLHDALEARKVLDWVIHNLPSNNYHHRG